ncbi:MAG: hypothetical protein KBS39_03535, partial [Lachnospiraceae bacterium]|nr:hypothetical protein [Candidatus Hippenecus merdae]
KPKQIDSVKKRITERKEKGTRLRKSSENRIGKNQKEGGKFPWHIIFEAAADRKNIAAVSFVVYTKVVPYDRISLT